MKKEIFNLKELVSVEIRDKKECRYVKYKLYKKSFWGDTIEGFYYEYSDACYTKEAVENEVFFGMSLLVENNIAYYFPYVRLTFTGEAKTIREFKTYTEAEAWGNEMSQKGMNSRLIIDGESYTTENTRIL